MMTRSVAVTEASQRRLLKRIEGERLEFVLSVESFLLPEIVDSIRRRGMKIAMWFPDAVSNLDRQLMLLAPYDAVFFKDRLLVERLNALLDRPIYYLPEACNPEWHRVPGDVGYLRSVVVAGNLYGTRALLLDRLHRAGVPLTLYGPGWPRWIKGLGVQSLVVNPEIWRHEKARVFRSAAAVLNNLHPGEMDSMNCRLFEAAGCGAAVLTERRPALNELFDVDRELLAFSSFDELVDQIRGVLDSPEKSFSCGDAASARAHSEHTYDHRLGTILSVLNGEIGTRRD